ncbi:MAG: hypothetical protein AABZ08_06900 [Planctomycetota bacterium]
MNDGPSPSMPSLGAYDRFFLASSLALLKKGLPGHHVFAQLALRGPLDLHRMRTRLMQILDHHPVLRARIECSRITKQPRWTVQSDAAMERVVRSSLQPEELVVIDLRDPATDRDAILRAAAQEQINPFEGPLIRLWVFQIADDRHDLVLRWPHHLMDLTGAERLLAELGSEEGQATIDSPDAPSLGFRRSLAAWCRGMWQLRQVNFLKGNRLKAATNGEPLTVETLRLAWTPEQSAAIDAAARASCAPGPMLHTRWQIASLVRAVDAVFARADVHRREHYLVSLPQRRDPPMRRDAIAGNDLTIGTLILHRDTLTNPHAADAALVSQLADHARRGLDDANERATAFAGRFPLPVYAWLLGRFRIFPRYSIGFTAYRADDMAGGFLGCTVEDMTTWVVPTSPPGILAAFCRFRDRLSFSLTYFSNACPPTIAFDICNEMNLQLGATGLVCNPKHPPAP